MGRLSVKAHVIVLMAGDFSALLFLNKSQGQVKAPTETVGIIIPGCCPCASSEWHHSLWTGGLQLVAYIASDLASCPHCGGGAAGKT